MGEPRTLLTGTLCAVTPRDHRASWARETTQYDPPNVEPTEPTTEISDRMVSPVVKAACERIERGVESLHEAIEVGHKLWHESPRAVDRAALAEAAALVGRRIGKPVR